MSCDDDSLAAGVAAPAQPDESAGKRAGAPAAEKSLPPRLVVNWNVE